MDAINTRLGRRTWLRASTAGLLGWSLGSRLPATESKPAVAGGKRCIVLWMDGGPSHIDTFDPKPDASSNVRGEFDTIATAIPGVQFSERFGKLAQRAARLAVVRGMCTEEADHGRARIYMHTGFRPGQGGLTYPALGSVVSAELGRDDSPLPNFVATGVPLGKYDFVTEPGYRGPRHTALSHYDANRPLDNLDPAVARDEFVRRQRTLVQINAEFIAKYRTGVGEAHQAVQDRATRLMQADAAKAFDLSKEPDAGRQRYGDHSFGRGCLLARRLVEVGVPFVEIYLGNWDTHEKRVVDEARENMPIVDHGMSTLLDDLNERGLLDDTLVVWMGEFGRTPHVNRNGGRDHFAKAWCTLLAGGGIRGGQVIGRTDHNGAEVVDRRVSARDFMATICRTLGIDPAKEVRTPIGRKIGIVDQGATPIAELFG